MLLLGLLMACGGESVVFEEVEAEPVEAVDEAEPIERDDYDPVNVPEDGRPEVEAQAQAQAKRKQWPPITVPGDQREREWEWDFEYKGPTNKEGNVGREETLDELNRMEMETEKSNRR